MITPRYLGTRHRSNRGDRLVLWHQRFPGGRRMVATRDCPECADGKVEVGHDSSVAECVELARYLLRKERGARAAEQLAVRFTDEVIVHLPCDRTWSIDACTIRNWADDLGPVVARFSGDHQDHHLPPAGIRRSTGGQVVYPGGGANTQADPIVLDADARDEMGSVLASITENAF